MRNIGNIQDLENEIVQFYPSQVNSAISYLTETYELDIQHAAHIASVLWQTLHHKNPWNLPKLTVYVTYLNMN